MGVSGQLHTPAALPPRERAHATHWIGGWVGPRAVLDAVVKRKISSTRRESNPRTPDRPARSPALYRQSYHGSYSTRERGQIEEIENRSNLQNEFKLKSFL
jgi:hypothetical protein